MRYQFAKILSSKKKYSEKNLFSMQILGVVLKHVTDVSPFSNLHNLFIGHSWHVSPCLTKVIEINTNEFINWWGCAFYPPAVCILHSIHNVYQISKRFSFEFFSLMVGDKVSKQTVKTANILRVRFQNLFLISANSNVMTSILAYGVHITPLYYNSFVRRNERYCL